jgi:CBS domain containing-hemolysin-like protein
LSSSDLAAPLSGSVLLLRLGAIALLILLNAFFVATEYAIVSVRRSRISQLASAGDLQARSVESLQRSLDRLLSTTQLGITLASLALGWISEATLVPTIQEWLGGVYPPYLQQSLNHGLALVLAFGLVAYLQIVLGELCPKALALTYPEQLARILAPISVAIARVFHPFVWLLNHSTRWLLQRIGIRYADRYWHSSISLSELQLLISSTAQEAGLPAEDQQLISNVLEFGEVRVADVMVPRTNMVALPASLTLSDLLEAIRRSGHARFPVLGPEEDLDDVVGIIDFRSLAAPMAAGELNSETALVPWVKPAEFVSEAASLKELLPRLRQAPLPMVIVVDEYGGTEGLLTVQDVIAEILGESDQDADEADLIRRLDDQTWLVQAQENLEEVNERLGIDLPLHEDYNTLGGFLIERLQKLPQAGDQVNWGQLCLTVVSTEGRRLNDVEIHLLDPDELDLSKGGRSPDSPPEQSEDLIPRDTI